MKAEKVMIERLARQYQKQLEAEEQNLREKLEQYSQKLEQQQNNFGHTNYVYGFGKDIVEETE